MKAIIPVAGAGTRLRPLTYTQPKPLIPVAGKPILAFLIDELIDQGVQEFIFIIGYLGEKIRHYVEAAYPQIDKVFVAQQERLGSAHAIWLAKEAFADADEVIIFFGDVILDADFPAIVHHSGSCIGLIRVEAPWEFGVAELQADGRVMRLEEKPRIPKSDLAMVGIYKIKEVSALIEAIAYNMENGVQTLGEYQLTDALQRMIDEGEVFHSVVVDNWFDCGKRDVLLDTNAIFLKREGYSSQDLPNFDNSIVIHPVSIGPGCEIKNSIVGPHVTIGHDAVLESAIVRDSIIGDYAALREVILQRSVIGNDTSITGLRQSLNIGDNTEIDFR